MGALVPTTKVFSNSLSGVYEVYWFDLQVVYVIEAKYNAH